MSKSVDTLEAFSQSVKRTSPGDHKGDEALKLAALGISGEAGEVADIIKKYMYHDHPINTHRIAEELGDILWYISYMCDAIGVDLGAVMWLNMAKLTRRYPYGFDTERSINRGDNDDNG